MADRLKGKDYSGPSQKALDAAKEMEHLDGQSDQWRWVVGDDLVAKLGPAAEHGVKDGSRQEVTDYLSQLNEAAGTEHAATAARHWRTTASRWPTVLRDVRKPWTWHMALNGVPDDEKPAALRKVRGAAGARKIAKQYRPPPKKKTAEERVVVAMSQLVKELERSDGAQVGLNYLTHVKQLHAALGRMLSKHGGTG